MPPRDPALHPQKRGMTEIMTERGQFTEGPQSLICEMVSWKLHHYVPTGAVGGDVLAPLLERYPLLQVSACDAA